MLFELKKKYSFTTLAPAVLGSNYTDMLVKAMMSAEDAVTYRDIYTLHNTLKTTIPTLPASVDDCTYILFEKQDNNKTKLLLALEYIDTFSIQNTQSVNVVITLMNTNTDMVSVVSTRLRELGINNFTISTS